MKRFSTFSCFFLLLLGILAPGCPGYADVKVRTQLQNNVLRVGEDTQLAVIVETTGEQIRDIPVIPNQEGLNFVFTSQQQGQSFQIINGRASANYSYTFFYDVLATREGKYTIDNFRIQTDSKTVKAPSFQITVFPGAKPIPTRAPKLSSPQGASQLNIYLLTDSTKNTLYQGEELILSYDTVYHQKWRRWFDTAIFNNRNYTSFDEKPGAFKNFLAEPINMKFKDKPKPVRLAGERDLYFQKSLLRYVLFPLTPGDYSLIPLTVTFHVPLQKIQSFPVTPEPVEIHVKPLPDEGKPPIFEGAVGEFNLKAVATPLELNEGDTVNLKITLEGFGNVKNAPKPTLPDLTQFDQFDPTQQENITVDENGMRGTIDFSYVLIPHDVNANRIGAVQYAYFDPKQEKYVIKKTPPIMLTIFPSSHQNRSAIGMVSNRRLITRVGDDFRFIATQPAALSTILLPAYLTMQYWFFLLVPAGIFILVYVWNWRKEYLQARPAVANSLKAPKRARKLLAHARSALENNEMENVYVHLDKAIRDFISNRWNLACAGMTSLDLKKSLLQVGFQDQQAHAVIQLLDELDGARFSGTMFDREQIQRDFSRTEQLLVDLMRFKRT